MDGLRLSKPAARRQGGRGMATAGIVTGWIGTILALLGLIAFIALLATGLTLDGQDDFENDFDEDPFSLLRPAVALARAAALFVT